VLFELAIRASQGARRSQEDTALAWPDNSAQVLTELPTRVAAVLCDGMGGHIGGALASRTASEAFLPSLLELGGTTRDRLMRALEQANIALTDQVNRNPAFNGMGSTLVGADVDANGLSWISVGDSLLYLWRAGEIAMLNADHSLAPEIDKLASTGKISWAAARSDPRRHYLRSALTGDEIEMIDLSERAAPLLPGDVILLASDGINSLELDTIALIVGNCANKDADAIATRLISTVDAAGHPHQDNTTIVAIRVLAEATSDQTTSHSDHTTSHHV
jgi:PPM family protein phosphatase